MVEKNKSNWMQLYSGKQFWPFEADIDSIDIEDIAHALSNTCRFSGHCLKYYSVAEHSLLMSYCFSDKKLALEALLHDATECYLTDLPRPIKRNLSEYVRIEENLYKLISTKYDLPYPISDVVISLDNDFLATEKDRIMRKTSFEWDLTGTILADVEFKHYDPETVKELFLKRFYELTS